MSSANADQHAAWNGESGRRWVAIADRRDAVLAPIADLVLAAASIRPGERVLDIGCGCGATTLAAATAAGSSATVVGADLSDPMLDVARARRRAHRHVELRRADVQVDALGGPFDVAISRFGTMFFDDPAAAFENIARHLTTGGRLCIATWQPLDANPWLLVPTKALEAVGGPADAGTAAGPGMFSQSDPSALHHLLRTAGFDRISTEPRTVPLRFGADVDEATDYLADSGPARVALEAMPAVRHPEARNALRAALRPHHQADRGVVLDASVLITTAAHDTSPGDRHP